MTEDALDMTMKRDALRSLDMTEDKPDMTEDTLNMTVERDAIRSPDMTEDSTKSLSGN